MASPPQEKDPPSANAYLYRAAYSACIDIIRARKRFGEPPREPQSPQTFSEATEIALLSLKPADRAIVYGRIVEDVTSAELAVRFDRSEAWVRKRYSLALQKLEKQLYNQHSQRKG